jgi:hypothetical protein
MSKKPKLPLGLDAQATMRALRRARDAARQIAARTDTPLVIYRNGKIELVRVNALPAPVGAGTESSADSEP